MSDISLAVKVLGRWVLVIIAGRELTFKCEDNEDAVETAEEMASVLGVAVEKSEPSDSQA